MKRITGQKEKLLKELERLGETLIELHMPSGELFRLAPLLATGVLPQPSSSRIEGWERFSADALEGKIIFSISAQLARLVLLNKAIGDFRACIVVPSPRKEVSRAHIPAPKSP